MFHWIGKKKAPALIGTLCGWATGDPRCRLGQLHIGLVCRRDPLDEPVTVNANNAGRLGQGRGRCIGQARHFRHADFFLAPLDLAAKGLHRLLEAGWFLGRERHQMAVAYGLGSW
jgi:hypothetical protein